ncbi:MAG TPA: hypothetical protein VI612_03305 [Candidatus Nanoarchaeia archaeon]|nr:hypothetical protein [Candidatus Nanoarchaeia archaeon]
MTLITTLDKAWTAFWKNKRYLILTVLMDFLFLFAMVQIHWFYFIPSAEAMMKVGEQMTSAMQGLPETELVDLNAVLINNPEFMQAYKNLLTNIVLFFLSLLGAWLVFKTFSWYLSHKSIYKKIPLAIFAYKFILLSLLWFVVLVATIFAFLGLTRQQPLPIISQTTSSIILFALIAVVAYFANISFALIPAQQTLKKTFTLGTKHAKKIVPAYIVNLLLLFVGISLPITIITKHSLIALAIILIFTLPALAFARINIIIATWLQKSS